MDAFLDRLVSAAATVDELLSDDFETVDGQKADADRAALRLAAWCRASASGDWALFARRLERDGWATPDVLARFATARRIASAPQPLWVRDAAWLDDALTVESPSEESELAAAVPFGPLLQPVVLAAEARLWADAEPDAHALFDERARKELREGLRVHLANLLAPALYERFDELRDQQPSGAFDRFVVEQRTGGWRRMFERKPVLLRLLSSLTRQWLEASGELIGRVQADLPELRRGLLTSAARRVTHVDTGLSDPHHFGRSVAILDFDDGSKVVYKPKDLRVDAAWAALVAKLNPGAPIALRAANVLVRDGYGWTEFIAHSDCATAEDVALYFRRAGAWLALMHGLASVDMHQENVIAAGAQPIPIDLEMILQAVDDRRAGDGGGSAAHVQATELVIDSVLTVGLLPAYAKHSNDKLVAIGGITSNTARQTHIAWTAIDSDEMRPERRTTTNTIANLPTRDGVHGRLGDHVDEFTEGFAAYAHFLGDQPGGALLDGFAGLPVRMVMRPTRFYYMLLGRLRDHHAMDDGVRWSVQADFVARLADWETDADPTWPALREERAALTELNIPHFVVPGAVARAEARLAGLDADEIAWQVEVISQNTGLLKGSAEVPAAARVLPTPPTLDELADVLADEAGSIAKHLIAQAIRGDGDAAWVGLDWVGDTEVSQLVVLGPELYNGSCGIALFLAAHARYAQSASSAEVAMAALAPLRAAMRGRHPARVARSLGVGGALGMGSVVYALAAIADLLDDADVLDDAHRAAALITDELIAADRQLDVLGGCAGAILGLLRLYRQTGSQAAMERARRCGDHLVAAERKGEPGQRTWTARSFGVRLNGMSHGAAGFAHALASLGEATRDERYAEAADECLAFELSTFDQDRDNWTDLRGSGTAGWPSKWCYGAPGIGLARAAMHQLAPSQSHADDVRRAVAGATRSWPVPTDTLCCGTLGTIELLWEAADVLSAPELRHASQRSMLAVVQAARARGDYAWSNGSSRFNLGLFRGIAGVGYTALRRVDAHLPNVLSFQ